MKQFNFTTAFAQIAIYWLGFVSLALGLALLDQFNLWLPITYLLGGIGFLAFASPQYTDNFLRNLRPLAAPFAIILIATIIAGYFTTPTIFTGRDQGSIATAAMMLTDNGTRAIHLPESDAFYNYYGAGKALNFPGFFYSSGVDGNQGALITGFSLPYISYLAVFYGIFGTVGFIIANVILICLFTIALYLLVNNLLSLATSNKNSQIAQIPTWLKYFPLAAVVATFPFLWFIKYTLTENLALFLIWVMLLALVELIRTPRILWYATLLLAGGLLILTRIEGIALVGITLLILLVAPSTNKFLRTHAIERLLIPLLAFILLFGVVFRNSIDFYKMVIKGFIGQNSTEQAEAAFAISTWLASTANQYATYLSYGMLFWVIGGFAGIYLLWKLHKQSPNTSDNFWLILTPALVVAPTFLYLIDANISPDAPWMLRRWSFALVPLGIAYTAIALFLIAQTKNNLRKFVPILASGLLASSLVATGTFITYSEHPQLETQIAKFATNFTAGDLVLIDGGATGDGFALASGPLRTEFGISSAYFFNPADLRRVSFAQFDTVFLLIPNTQIPRYQGNLQPGITLTPLTQTTFTTNFLTPPPNPFLHLATKTTKTTINTLFRVEFNSN